MVRHMTFDWRFALVMSVLVIVGVAFADVPPSNPPPSAQADDPFAAMNSDQVEGSLLGTWNMHLDAPDLAKYEVPADYVLTITSVRNGKVKASETPRLAYYIRDGKFDIATRTLTLWREYHGICIGCGIWKWSRAGLKGRSNRLTCPALGTRQGRECRRRMRAGLVRAERRRMGPPAVAVRIEAARRVVGDR